MSGLIGSNGSAEAVGSDAVIEISNLQFGYRAGQSIIELDSLKILRGTTNFIHGPSGCGKTTLLGLLAGILAANRGEIRVLGHMLGNMNRHQRDRLRGQQIGYIFQLFNLIPYLSVRDNILLPLWLHQPYQQSVPTGAVEGGAVPHAGGSKFDAEAQLARLACLLEIESLIGMVPGELSVGQQQRVAAARALITNPPLLIADEPTSALDERHKHQFMELLFASVQNSRTTLLFVSHDLRLKDRFEAHIDLPRINRANRCDDRDTAASNPSGSLQ